MQASCVPAHVLDPAPSTTVLDCCAAPGNKTSHLASLLKNDGRVIALDRDLKRLGTMENLLSNSGATCVELIHQDFLTVDPTSEDAKDVQFILVDPSCSGSGILNHQTNASGLDVDSNRIQTLKRFQISILKHALSFPNVSRVVYSTCSIHSEENEEVAEEVMAQVSDKYRFRPVLKQWRESRGLDKFPHASFFLRLSPTQDLTQGFFVACFERVGKEVASVENDTACVTNKKDQTVSEAKVERKKIKKMKKSCDFPTELHTEMEIQPESVDAEAQAAGNKKNLSQLQRKKKKRKHAELDTHLDKQTEKKYCVDDLQISIKNQSSLKSLPGATGASSFKVPDPLDSSAATKKNVKKVKKNKLKGSQ
ncbi:25S rRNA (cytosine-c(5))-methyltransferase rcm1 [Plakobranchus ocellatus]|uniref:25S rRNA (Cytosine-c(5))-methyltransferase rcm1 n=1 Tax=Plakobranchus ocellatus TaxID=259542 RepID=A0AAV4BSN8_9GAST|nr:25S rRNA (cytosine-c(5))-methyltransferase rcm1 [Plakobranchus ocellatus]